MRSNLPPITIDGFEHPHAFTGIPVRIRPEWGCARCPTCLGHGARNDILHLDSMRCRIHPCQHCEGSGWSSADGTLHRPQIVFLDGYPAWTVDAHKPLPRPTVVMSETSCACDEDVLAEAA